MRRSARQRAALGSAVFFVAAPCVVAGVIPWWISGYDLPERSIAAGLRMAAGLLLVLAGILVLLRAFTRFVTEGRGTPAPIAPTDQLVLGGEYRYVRNPMYVAVVGCVIGQAVLFGSLPLFAYAGGIWLLMAAFVRWYEEPVLRARYGSRYDEYRRAVPAWVPTLRPWTPDD